MITMDDIKVYDLPDPIPKEWEEYVNRVLKHDKYDKASKKRGFGGESKYRKKGVLNHKISHYFINKFHIDNGINAEMDETWTIPDEFDVRVNGKIVQIKSKADRNGTFNLDWACEIPIDHYEKYKDIFGIIFSVTDFNNNRFMILGYLKKEDFDEKKKIIKLSEKFRDGKEKIRGGTNVYVYSDELDPISDYLNEIKE